MLHPTFSEPDDRAQRSEAAAREVVAAIRGFVDGLRAEFSSRRQHVDPIPLYSRMVEKGFLERVRAATRAVGEGNDGGGDENDMVFSGTHKEEKDEANNNSDNDNERQRVLRFIVLPLIRSLVACYRILDSLPRPQPTPPPNTPNNNNRARSRRNKAPPPPPGMLSIQDYTDVACLLEFTVCTSILLNLEPHVAITLEDRIKYHLPKALAGRIPRSSLSWASNQGSPKAIDHSEELCETAAVIADLVSIDRFRPMLLPRHIADLYAAVFQSEENDHKQQVSQPADPAKTLQRKALYQFLGLAPPLAAPSSSSPRTAEASLRAKAYQTLLLQGTKGPPWVRRRISPLLTRLASTNLVAIVQVFVPLQEPSMASQRLGRTLALSSSSASTTTQVEGTTGGLGSQIRRLLEAAIFPAVRKGEIPAPAMALLQTIWAILYHWPDHLIQQELVRPWQEGMLLLRRRSSGDKPTNTATIETNNKSVHRTIRQIGALCAWVPPTNQVPLRVLKHLFTNAAKDVIAASSDAEGLWEGSVFDRLVRVGSMCRGITERTTIVVSPSNTHRARLDACQTLQWVSHAVFASKERVALLEPSSPGHTSRVEASGPTLLASAWVHALAPSGADVAGVSFQSVVVSEEANSDQQKAQDNLEDIVFTSVTKTEGTGVADLVAGISNRATVLSEVILDVLGGSSDTKEGGRSLPEQSATQAEATRVYEELPSHIFQLLLRLYLSSPAMLLGDAQPMHPPLGSDILPSTDHMPFSFANGLRLVSMTVLPMLCEKANPESLLFGSRDGTADGALGLLNLIKLILVSCAVSWSEYKIEDSSSNVSFQHAADDTVPCLLALKGGKQWQVPTNEDRLRSLIQSPLQDPEDRETLLSISSIVLSLLIAVLELGSELRSKAEESLLQSLLPILASLAQFHDNNGGDVVVQNPSYETQNKANAGIADMSGYAMALLASRDSPKEIESCTSRSELDSNPMHKLRNMIGEAEEDLQSSQPPLRARGMVTLGRLARGYLGILPKEKESPLVVELHATTSVEEVSAVLVQEVLRLSLTALLDDESYVFLAAVQTIVAIGDMQPKRVLPTLCSAIVSGKTKTGPSADTATISKEQRIKLAEAVMFIIRRRAAPDEFVPFVVSQMLFGSTDRMATRDIFGDSEAQSQRQFVEETNKYFLHVNQELESGHNEDKKQILEERNVRVRTGGPVFLLEEVDVVRSLRLSILSELTSNVRPSSLAPYCAVLVRLIMDVLRLDSSRAVCRAGALLSRELYSCVLREQDELAETVGHKGRTSAPLPMTVALISSDEDSLISILKQLAEGSLNPGNLGIRDETTAVRCSEALQLRNEADEVGLFAAASLLRTTSSASVLPNILSIVEDRQLPSLPSNF